MGGLERWGVSSFATGAGQDMSALYTQAFSHLARLACLGLTKISGYFIVHFIVFGSGLLGLTMNHRLQILTR